MIKNYLAKIEYIVVMLHTSLLRGGELIRGKLKIKNKKFVDFIGNNLSARLVGVIIVDSKWAREE